MTYSSGNSLMSIRFQNLTRVKAQAVIIAFLVLMIPRLWADSQKEYIYIGGEVVAVETITQQPACTYGISPTSASPAAGGATGSVSVTVASGCAWTASSDAPSWITITSGASGTGSGTVGYSVAANTGSQRTGTLTIAGKTFTVTQAAPPPPPCTYSISPTSASPAAGGGSGSVSVTGGSGCAWTATSNALWITITSGSSGTGNGTVGYSVAANTGSQRTGTLTIAGKTFTVTQAAPSPPPCTYSISPTSITHAPNGGSGAVSITASSSSCVWTTTNNASSWVTITSGSSGTGSGTLKYMFTTNTYFQRSGTITIAGKTFTITQDSGVACESQYFSCINILSPQAENCSYECGMAAMSMGCYPEYPGCYEWYYNCISECEAAIYWDCEHEYNNCMSGY